MPSINEFEDYKRRVRDFLKERDQFYQTYVASDWTTNHATGVSSSLKEQLKDQANALLKEDSDLEDIFADTFSGEDDFEIDDEWSRNLLGRLTETHKLNGISQLVAFLDSVPTSGGRRRATKRNRRRRTMKRKVAK